MFAGLVDMSMIVAKERSNLCHPLKVKSRAVPSRNLYNTYQYIAQGLGLSYHTNIKA